jgi:integrase
MARRNKPWFRASKGTWYATVDGKQVSLHVQGEDSEEEAVKAWHRLMAGVEEEKVKAKEGPTVAEVVKAFLADCDGRMKATTLRWYTDFLTPFVIKHGRLKVSDLTAPLAEGFARKPDWSPSTRHDFLGVLAGAFKWAERARLIDRTPLMGLKRPPKESRGAETLVSPHEHARLCENASRAFRLFLQVAYATGARPGEVASITAENFNADLGVVRLKEHKTSHKGKGRTIYLTPEVVALLVRQKGLYPTGALLRNRCGKPWTGWAIVKAMKYAREKAGISHAITYGLRHSFATDALANGVPDAHVAELLGHSGTAMLHKHYSHLTARAQALRSALGQVRG